jgi:D-3-phosphoglycerate dehydrogenase / 2-oxoglutarate reductase
MSQLTVLVTDYTWDSTDREAAVLAEVGAGLVVARSGDEDELVRLVGDADAILTCFARVTPAVVRAGEKLRVIGRYGIGVDNIAVEEATRRGIPVTNVPAYCLDEVAEHVLALIFCLERGIHHYDRAVRDGDWALAVGQPIRRIAGRTLGVIGFGKIGRTVTQRAQALGMRVIVHDSRADAGTIAAAGAEPVALLALAARADFVTLHVPATPDTEGLIDARFLAEMRPDAYLINTARGAVVDQVALTQALAERRIAGAGLDVFVPERLAPDDDLLAQPGLLATPHVAFYSEQSVAELATLAARNVATVLAGGRAVDTVNRQIYEEREMTT